MATDHPRTCIHCLRMRSENRSYRACIPCRNRIGRGKPPLKPWEGYLMDNVSNQAFREAFDLFDRLAIVGAMCTPELADWLGMTQEAAATKLRRLYDRGFISWRRRAQPGGYGAHEPETAWMQESVWDLTEKGRTIVSTTRMLLLLAPADEAGTGQVAYAPAAC